MGAVLGILLIFHSMVFVSFAIQGDQIPPIVIHAVMAVIAIVLYSQRRLLLAGTVYSCS